MPLKDNIPFKYPEKVLGNMLLWKVGDFKTDLKIQSNAAEIITKKHIFLYKLILKFWLGTSYCLKKIR